MRFGRQRPCISTHSLSMKPRYSFPKGTILCSSLCNGVCADSVLLSLSLTHTRRCIFFSQFLPVGLRRCTRTMGRSVVCSPYMSVARWICPLLIALESLISHRPLAYLPRLFSRAHNASWGLNFQAVWITAWDTLHDAVALRAFLNIHIDTSGCDEFFERLDPSLFPMRLRFVDFFDARV